MASEQTLPVNGNYSLQQPSHAYGMSEQTYASHAAPNSMATDYSDPTGAQGSSSSSGRGEIRQDEVGWYFVEQYYTTMSRNPEKLFLFYNKRSQYICGVEAEKVNVSVGQREINERIRELDIQDCKVRVSNVDSQGSGQNIVIQVIGEISTKGKPQKKFTQTFVLAEQTNGYYVLNDIFRYILEDEDQYDGDQAETAPVEAATGYQEPQHSVDPTHVDKPETLTSSDDPVKQEEDAAKLDKSLEEAIDEDPAIVTTESNADATTDVAAPETDIIETEDAPAGVPATVEDEPEIPVVDTSETEAIPESEGPVDPEPTPAASSPKPAAAQAAAPPAPAKPAAPKTWASMLAGPKGPAPAVPAIPANAAQPPQLKPASAQSQATTPPALSTTGVAPTQEPEQSVTPVSSGSEWQMADHGKKQTRPQGVSTPTENSRAYIKNVSENIEPQALRTVLNRIAEVSYLDINRQKNCAFVDFATPAGYQAAVAANPHEVHGERIFVEERRVRPQSFAGGYGPRGGIGRGGARGGSNGPNGPGRGGFPKEGQRGGFNNNRGGRGGVAPRGRGVQSAA